MKTQNQLTSCSPFDDDLKAYLDGELPLWRRLKLRAHLARCPQCMEELKLMQTIEKEVQSEAIPPLKADLRAKILRDTSASNDSVATPTLPVTKKRSRVPFEYALVLGGIGLCGLVMLTITGNSTRHTFNAAANAITADSFASSEKIRAEAPSAAAISGSVSEIQRRSSVANGDITERAVHKEGSLTIAVTDSEASGSAVETIVKNSGGFVATNTLSTGDGGLKSATLDVRVPVAQFEATMKKIGSLGTVKAKNINGEDLTTRVAVAGARKETLSRELSLAQARLRNLLAKKNATTSQNYLARAEVRSLNLQAAQAKAELSSLQRFAALSTLYVTLQDKAKVTPPATFSGSLSQTGSEAWNSFLNSARLPLQLLIWILAYSPLWLPALLLWRKFGRRLAA